MDHSKSKLYEIYLYTELHSLSYSHADLLLIIMLLVMTPKPSVRNGSRDFQIFVWRSVGLLGGGGVVGVGEGGAHRHSLVYRQ